MRSETFTSIELKPRKTRRTMCVLATICKERSRLTHKHLPPSRLNRLMNVTIPGASKSQSLPEKLRPWRIQISAKSICEWARSQMMKVSERKRFNYINRLNRNSATQRKWIQPTSLLLPAWATSIAKRERLTDLLVIGLKRINISPDLR